MSLLLPLYMREFHKSAVGVICSDMCHTNMYVIYYYVENSFRNQNLKQLQGYYKDGLVLADAEMYLLWS